MHAFVFSASRSVRINSLFPDSRLFDFEGVFNHHFLPEVDDVERWISIPNLLPAQQIFRKFDKNCGSDSATVLFSQNWRP